MEEWNLKICTLTSYLATLITTQRWIQKNNKAKTNLSVELLKSFYTHQESNPVKNKGEKNHEITYTSRWVQCLWWDISLCWASEGLVQGAALSWVQPGMERCLLLTQTILCNVQSLHFSVVLRLAVFERADGHDGNCIIVFSDSGPMCLFQECKS